VRLSGVHYNHYIGKSARSNYIYCSFPAATPDQVVSGFVGVIDNNDKILYLLLQYSTVTQCGPNTNQRTPLTVSTGYSFRVISYKDVSSKH
jgi:hypothetical protein